METKPEERTMAQNRRELFEVIKGLKKNSLSIDEGTLIIKACHEITDTFRVEIRGCEVAGELAGGGLAYKNAVLQLE